jgi:hypothetical protein
VHVSEIVIERSGQRRMIVVDATPAEGQYRPPLQRHFAVDDFSSLPPAPPDVANAPSQSGIPFPYAYAVSSFLPIALFARLSHEIARLNKHSG